MEQFGRLLIITGVVIAFLGVVLMLGPRLPFRLGRMPLDFSYERESVRFYFPLGTSILVSLILSLILAVLNRR